MCKCQGRHNKYKKEITIRKYSFKHFSVISMLSSFLFATLKGFGGISIQCYENEQCLYLLNFMSKAFIYSSCLIGF